jgi:hypothetical protein
MRQTFSEFVDQFFSDPNSYGNAEPLTIDQIMYQINFNDWIYNVGPDPTGTLNFQTSQTMAATNLANAYIYGPNPTVA